MRTEKTPHPGKRTRRSIHVENTTDATRGEPLAARARTRKAELEQILAAMPAGNLRARSDIEIALGAVNELLTDEEHGSHVTRERLSRWLEHSKHLAEVTPKARRSSEH